MSVSGRVKITMNEISSHYNRVVLMAVNQT